MTREAHMHLHPQTMMTAQQGAERELKFVADRKTFKAAVALPLLGGAAEVPEWGRLKSVYFDTEDDDLMRQGVTLRVRQENAAFVMGLKRAADAKRGFFDRNELEVKSPLAEPDFSLFDEAIAREIKEIIGEKPLAPKFGSDIRRATRTVYVDGSAIEVALDQGSCSPESSASQLMKSSSSLNPASRPRLSIWVFPWSTRLT